MPPTYNRKDHYYRKAKAEGLASRAVYKLEEIDRRFRLIPQGGKVVDLGCAPGGWLQYIGKKVGPSGKVVGIDLLPVQAKLSPQVSVLQGDASDPKILKECLQILKGEADAVLSDMSPNLSGITFRDQSLSHELAESVLRAAKTLLRTGGALLLKVFPGDETPGLRKKLKGSFEEIKTYIPEATRKGSSEVYLAALRFKGGDVGACGALRFVPRHQKLDAE